MLSGLFSKRKKEKEATNVAHHKSEITNVKADSSSNDVHQEKLEKSKKTIVSNPKDRINECMKSGGEILDISKLNLTEIPIHSICTNVTTLNARNNHFSTYNGLQQFVSIKVLDLSNCGIENIAATGICALIYLRSLDLSRNKISEIPDEMRFLSALEVLILHRNKLQKLSTALSQLTYLRALDLSYNNLNSISIELENLSRLEDLNLSENPSLDPNAMGEATYRLFIQVFL